MQLSKLLLKAGLSVLKNDIIITGLSDDSRKVKPGFLFAALSSTTVSAEVRLGYIREALTRGAGALLVASDMTLPDDITEIPIIYNAIPRALWGHLIACYYGISLSSQSHIVAVTGTNGKSSTVHILQHLWERSHKKAASIGTLGIKSSFFDMSAQTLPDSGMTTPDNLTLHTSLQALYEQHITHIALEASSHGLDQYRLNGIDLAAAAFTNITQDHLDYHHTMEAYFSTKMRLFSEVLRPYKTAVIAADNSYYDKIASLCASRHHTIVDYGWKGKALKLCEVTPRKDKPGQYVKTEIYGKKYDFFLPLSGNFQVLNSLCALGLFLAEKDSSIEQGLNALENLPPVPGRVELVGVHPTTNALIYIDYAHTPDALKQLLISLRPHTAGALHLVFGCGGNRDNTKRGMMGSIASTYADVVIVTDDNPRSEDPKMIRQAILQCCPKAKDIGLREEAIYYAISRLEPKDILVIAGKGHEKTQIIEDKIIPFDDKVIVQEAIVTLHYTL